MTTVTVAVTIPRIPTVSLPPAIRAIAVRPPLSIPSIEHSIGGGQADGLNGLPFVEDTCLEEVLK